MVLDIFWNCTLPELILAGPLLVGLVSWDWYKYSAQSGIWINDNNNIETNGKRINCLVPENIYTLPVEGFFCLNLYPLKTPYYLYTFILLKKVLAFETPFPLKTLAWVWIFSGTTHYMNKIIHVQRSAMFVKEWLNFYLCSKVDLPLNCIISTVCFPIPNKVLHRLYIFAAQRKLLLIFIHTQNHDFQIIMSACRVLLRPAK